MTTTNIFHRIRNTYEWLRSGRLGLLDAIRNSWCRPMSSRAAEELNKRFERVATDMEGELKASDFGERAQMKYYAAKLNPEVEKLIAETQKFLSSAVEGYIENQKRLVEDAVQKIVKARFGVDYTPDTYASLVKKYKLALVFNKDNTFVGISANNRWLYTIDGKVIGKKDGRFLIENI